MGPAFGGFSRPASMQILEPKTAEIASIYVIGESRAVQQCDLHVTCQSLTAVKVAALLDGKATTAVHDPATPSLPVSINDRAGQLWIAAVFCSRRSRQGTFFET